MKILLHLLGVSSEFERLFYVNEYKKLAGDKNRTILALILILFLTLLALSYAVGSIQNLEGKMDNPYTNWVDLSMSSKYVTSKAEDIEINYTKAEKKEELKIDNVRGWVKLNFDIYHQDFNPVLHSSDTLSYATWGRTLEDDDILLGKVLSKENLIWKSKDFESDESEQLANCELLVTEDLMKRLGYGSNNPEIGGFFGQYLSNVLHLKIVGVVKELPNFSDFVCSPEFYNIYYSKIDGLKKCKDFIFSNESGRGSSFNFIASDKVTIAQLQKLAKAFFVIIEEPEIRMIDEYRTGISRWSLCEFSFLPSDKPSVDSIQLFLDYVAQKGSPLANILTLECSTDKCIDLNSDDYHYLAFNFSRLDDIRKFKDDMKENYEVEIDMTQVEAKENFALVGRLTLVISLILLAFGILSIILFVNNLLKSHLFKVRSNLGTFKAFGLSNGFLNTIYLKIIFSFLLLSILIALVFTIVIDRIEALIMMNESQFNVFSHWVLFALIGLILISLLISYNTIRKILGDTPGNLIYER